MIKRAKWALLCCCMIGPVFGGDLREVVKSWPIKGGVIVHLGCGDGANPTAELNMRLDQPNQALEATS